MHLEDKRFTARVKHAVKAEAYKQFVAVVIADKQNILEGSKLWYGFSVHLKQPGSETFLIVDSLVDRQLGFDCDMILVKSRPIIRTYFKNYAQKIGYLNLYYITWCKHRFSYQFDHIIRL